jgi:hypothetical protein
MNQNKLRRLFPNASPSFIVANSDRTSEVHSNNEEPSEGRSLDNSSQRETKSRDRFKIIFAVYSTRPADWDNYDIKALQDLLVKSGILFGDDWIALRGEIDPRKVDKKEEEKTVIYITPEENDRTQ